MPAVGRADEMAAGQTHGLAAFVPRVVLDWPASDGADTRHRSIDASMVFVDISGFTALSERLATYGREGAEEITQLLQLVFTELLTVAYAEGGSLLKFGGDALLLLFTDSEHPARAVRAAHGMRTTLQSLGALKSLAGPVRLGMSVGVHTAPYDLFLVGGSHLELIVAGPAVTELARLESAAGSGEILASPSTIRRAGPTTVGPAREGGLPLLSASAGTHAGIPPAVDADVDDVEPFLPTALRTHLRSGGGANEHRNAVVAFLAFGGTDELLTEAGPPACTEAIDELVRTAQHSADRYEVTLLGSDIAPSGGKLILTAGTPVAHDDDAERILRAARAIIEAGTRLPLQVGVNRGPLFSGVVGPPYRRTFTVMGDTVNLAARLAYQASPGQVLAAAQVAERTRTRFATTPTAPFTVKGKARPIDAVVIGEPLGARIEQSHRLPLAGREPELHLLESELAVSEHTGRALEIVGPAGIGKSRLLSEFRDRHPELRLYYASCDGYAVSTPYFAFRGLLRFLLGLDAGADASALATRTQDVDPTFGAWLPLIGNVVGIEHPMTPQVEELDVRFRAVRARGVVGELLQRLVPHRALIRIEDVHWIDTASRDLLQHIIQAVLPDTAWMMVVTSRDPELDGLAHERMTLSPLDSAAAESIADAAAARGLVGLATARRLGAMAGGHPLFLQELLVFADQLGDEVPESVEQLIAARIDQLQPPHRELLRHAALLGRRVDLGLLRSITGDAVDDRALQALATFLRHDEDDVFVFEHDLFREVAYAGLPFRRRRELHDRVARIIETRHLGATDQVAETLALHYHRAGRHDPAWTYNRLAARRARSAYALADAARFLRWALASSGRAVSATSDAVAAAWSELGDVLELLGDYTGAADAYSRARKLTPPQGRPELWYRSGIVREREGRYPEALRWYGRALRALEAQGSDDDVLRARLRLRRVEVRLLRDREDRTARRQLPALLAEIDALGDTALRARASFVATWALTRTDPDDGHARQALSLYEELGDLLGQANVLMQLGTSAYFRGDWNDATDLYGRAGVLKQRAGDLVQAAIAVNNQGEIRSDQGRFDAAASDFDRALTVFRAAGFTMAVAATTGNLGRLAARRGQFDDAEQTLQEALEIFERLGSRGWRHETTARLAELALFRGAADSAIEYAQEVIRDAADGTPVQRFAQRVHGLALALDGQPARGKELLERSRACAAAARARYDEALATVGLAWLLDDEADALRLEHTAGVVLERLDLAVPPLELLLGPAISRQRPAGTTRS